MKIEKSKIYPLFISLLIFLVISLVYTQLRIFEGLENGATDYRFFFRAPFEETEKIKLSKGKAIQYKPNPKARNDIIILGIDENTIREFSNQGILWPFPRNIHGIVSKFIGSGNPLAQFFDIMFIDRTEHDEEFAKDIKKAGNVFLDYPFETKKADRTYSDIKERIKIVNRVRFPLDPDDDTDPWIEEIVPPVPVLSKNSKGIGFANVKADSDHTVRRMPLIIKYDGYYYPNIDLLIIMHYFGITKDDVEVKIGKYIKLKNLPLEKMTKPNSEREIKIPIDEYGLMDTNYIGAHASYRNYSYYMFCNDGNFGNKSFENKIILIAAFSVTGIAKDIHKSPYGETFGIEHHANVLNTILNQDFIIKLKAWQNIIILLLIAVILGLLLTRLSIVTSIIFTLVFALLYVVGTFVVFEAMNLICVFSTPLLQIGLTFSFIIAYRVITEQKEKKQIRQTFSKLVAKSVVDELLKNPDDIKLGGDKKILTVLFSDIRGFTSISEKLTPEALVEHLNEYLEAMTNIVMKYEGTLDKYVGDEIMAFWGAPIPQEDHALLASRAAVEMMDVLNKMNKDWASLPEPKPPLDIGIGLNSGDMVVALMGSSSRMDYTLMGDNVNLGARLEGTNKVYKTNIIISEYTYEHVKDKTITRELDLIKVKGKELPVKIYELIDIKDS